jgi:hypothetical protein
MTIKICNDEPAIQDALDRSKYADSFAQVIQTCDTPLVIGLYGTWGVGKTSLMRLIQSKLDSSKCRSVWFDPWQHQFDEDPAIALLHTMVDELDMGEEGKKILTIIAGALGSILLKATTTLSTVEIQELSDKYEEERFQIREKQIRLRKHFKELIDEASNKGTKRLVFFIDDLDRCVPEQILKILEALKLYLNLHRCVYILGVDRSALEGSIKNKYKDFELNEASYLDKIIQLPFSIPPIAEKSMEEFIKPLLPSDLHILVPILFNGLGDNPRQIKRFINTFLLNHQLAYSMLREEYSPKILATILIVQYRQPELYKAVIQNPYILADIASGKEGVFSEILGKDTTTKQVIRDSDFSLKIDLSPYIYLSEVASVRKIEFDVIMNSYLEEKKIAVIKEIRTYTNWGLVEAKDFVESEMPVTIATGLSKEKAEELKGRFVAAGASVEVV